MLKRSAIAVLLTIAAAAASAETLTETFDRTFEVRPGALVSLVNTNGRITVHSWNQPRVRIQAQKRAESRDADAAKQGLVSLKIETAAMDGGLKVNTRYPKTSNGIMEWIAGTSVNLSVTYEVTVPRSMNLSLENTNGAMDLTDIHGQHHLETTNGHLELVQCGGSLDAETTNGAIRAEMLEVTPGKNVRAETTNGRITLSLPRRFSGNVDASTTNGSITTDLPVSTTDTGHRSLRGTINGGGPELRLHTTNGSIEIKASK
ncbi:MAG: DUF4097 family beta strand repeat-containing protein [Thermoanaerobaculia bacterium]